MSKEFRLVFTGQLVARMLLPLRMLALMTLCASWTLSGAAQQTGDQSSFAHPGLPTSVVSPLDSSPKKADDQYHIGAGDELTIQIFGKPQLSRDQYVDVNGMIRMPLLEQDIRAACRTESELAQEISRLYREHELLKNPAVYVSVKDYQSQPVAILGAVNNPGRFVLRRRVHLLEMVVFVAGGANAKAGRKVQILSTSPAVSCNAGESVADPAKAVGEDSLVTYDLQDVLAGKENANPYLQRGDIINIPAAEEAFVIGNVMRPSAIPIVDATTLGRALAMVGGTLPNTRKDKVRVIRQAPGSTSTSEILVDLASADKGKGSDFLLQGGDIIQVDTKTGVQNVLRGLAKALVPSVTNLPMQVMRY